MVALVLAGCTQSQLNGFLPGFNGKTPVTNHTERVSGLWVTSWIVLLLVGLVVYGVFGFASDALVRLLERRVLSWRRTLA